MSETPEPALHDRLHRVQHFGAVGRSPVGVNSLEAILDMLEQALQQA